jgi:tetratricopeptide (TPR) repeat protein
VDAAFRRLAMKYHPDRYKHHGKDARRLAQGVFVLLSDAKKALRPQPATASSGEAPRDSDSWRNLPPRHEEVPRQQHWTPQLLDLSDLESEPDLMEENEEERPPVEEPSAPESRTATKADERASGERVVPEEPELKARLAAFQALADGRFRDAKNHLGRLLDALGEEEIDEELELAFRLARGHLRWEEGFPDEAIDLFEEALELDPENEDALRALRDVREEQERKKSGLLNRLLGKS